MTDLTALSPEDFNALERDVRAERDRRFRQETVLETIAAQTTAYLAGGGDVGAVDAAVAQGVTDATTPEPETPTDG